MRTIILSAVMALCFLAVPAFSQSKEQSVDELLKVTGVGEQLGNLPATISALYGQQQKSFKKETYDAIQTIIAQSFSSEALLAGIKAEFLAHYDAKALAALLATYKKQLVKDITAAEVAHSAPEWVAKVDEFDYDSLPAARKKVVDELLASSRAVDLNATLTRDGLRAFLDSFNLFLPAERKIKPELADQIIANSVKQTQSEETLLRMKKSLAQCYADFKDAQLREYVRSLYQSPEGAWFMDNYYAGLDKAFAAAFRTMADTMKDTFGLKDADA